MLDELTKMINEVTGLTGKALEGAVLVVGLAVVDTLIEVRGDRNSQSYTKESVFPLYDINNHLAVRLHEVKQQIAASN